MKDFTPLIISADDRAFLEAQAYNIAEISRCFGVSEAMACPLIELNSGPFDNIAKQHEKFLKDHVPEFRWKLYDRIPRKTKKRLKKTAFILFGKLVLTAHKRK